MKIVHVVEPFAGGTVTFLKSLVVSLPDDFHIIVHGEREQEMPFSEVKKQFAYTNVKFLRWRSAQRSLRLQKDIIASIELFSILKRLKKNKSLDIVHLHSSKGGFIGRLVGRILGIQDVVVYTPNGAPFMVGTNPAANYLYKKLEKLACAFGGQVVCCSPSEQKAYESAGMNVVTINNGIPHEKAISMPARQQKDAIFRIVTSGRIVHQKNPVLFNKIASYFEEFSQFEFVWVGDGSDRHLLTAKNIQITGWLTKEQVNDIVVKADIYLSTANFEGLPFAVLEALALKKPVLLTDCIGNRDLVVKGLNGDVFKSKNEAIIKILQFYNNSSMLSVMGEHSVSHCKTSFNLFNTYQSYKELYQRAVLIRNESITRINQIALGTR